MNTQNSEIPYGYCHCGCGNKTNISQVNHKRFGRVKGRPHRYYRNHSGFKRADFIIDADGYQLIKLPEHHRASSNGYVKVHILKAEKALGRNLRDPECVHHHDGNKSNNEPGNIIICQDQAYHMLLHRRAKALRECGKANYRKCKICKQYDDPLNMVIYRDTQPHHKSCWNIYQNIKHAEKRRGNTLQNQ